VNWNTAKIKRISFRSTLSIKFSLISRFFTLNSLVEIWNEYSSVVADLEGKQEAVFGKRRSRYIDDSKDKLFSRLNKCCVWISKICAETKKEATVVARDLESLRVELSLTVSTVADSMDRFLYNDEGNLERAPKKK
jgi:hypothetical protein